MTIRITGELSCIVFPVNHRVICAADIVFKIRKLTNAGEMLGQNGFAEVGINENPLIEACQPARYCEQDRFHPIYKGRLSCNFKTPMMK